MTALEALRRSMQLADTDGSVVIFMIALVGVRTGRARLVSRIEVEAQSFRNADATTSDLRYGRVLGLLEAGTILGLWSRRSASRIGDAVYYGATPTMLRRMLKPP